MIELELLKPVFFGGVPNKAGAVVTVPLALGEALISGGSAKRIDSPCSTGNCPLPSAEPEAKPRRSRKADNEGVE